MPRQIVSPRNHQALRLLIALAMTQGCLQVSQTPSASLCYGSILQEAGSALKQTNNTNYHLYHQVKAHLQDREGSYGFIVNTKPCFDNLFSIVSSSDEL